MENKVITIPKPNDYHIHLRDNELLGLTVPVCCKNYRKATVMPNLEKPIDNMSDLIEYRNRILNNVPFGMNFEPLMTLYITKNLTINTLIDAKNSGLVIGCKLYPANATTNSSYGISDINQINDILKTMEDLGLILLIHGEQLNDENDEYGEYGEIDIIDREKEFIINTMPKLITKYPNLKIVLEHISSEFAVKYIERSSDNIAATITPHHLYYTINDIFTKNGKYLNCCPVIKGRNDRKALIRIATSGFPRVFIGTDSAPHTIQQKQDNNNAGIFNTPESLLIYLEIFDKYDSIDNGNFEKFISTNGAKFYGLPINDEKLSFIKTNYQSPNQYSYNNFIIPSMLGDNTISWNYNNNNNNNNE